jgi:hypothetical protein
MSATITLDSGQAGRDSNKTNYVRRGTISLGIYATNGVAVTKASFDLWHSMVGLDVRSSGGYIAEYVPTTAGVLSSGKIVVYYGDNNNASDGVLIEIPDTTDISATNFRFRAEGR